VEILFCLGSYLSLRETGSAKSTNIKANTKSRSKQAIGKIESHSHQEAIGTIKIQNSNFRSGMYQLLHA
jgi:hypothetical protein